MRRSPFATQAIRDGSSVHAGDASDSDGGKRVVNAVPAQCRDRRFEFAFVEIEIKS